VILTLQPGEMSLHHVRLLHGSPQPVGRKTHRFCHCEKSAMGPSPYKGMKNGTPSVHPLSGRELRALRRLRRETQASPFIFVKAGFEFPVHPHMLRHACGYALANAGTGKKAPAA
jgi:integrase